ncbi:TPA: hypothetical protein ACH3X2_012934 [Trebouxia sp. C0005]
MDLCSMKMNGGICQFRTPHGDIHRRRANRAACDQPRPAWALSQRLLLPPADLAAASQAGAMSALLAMPLALGVCSRTPEASCPQCARSNLRCVTCGEMDSALEGGSSNRKHLTKLAWTSKRKGMCSCLLWSSAGHALVTFFYTAQVGHYLRKLCNC